jgi:hypothetical protein
VERSEANQRAHMISTRSSVLNALPRKVRKAPAFAAGRPRAHTHWADRSLELAPIAAATP